MRKFGPTARHTRRIVLEVIKDLAFDSVLDVGCGTGTLLEDVRDRHPHVALFGSDFSPLATEITARNLPGAETAVLDLVEGPLPRRFDLVLCTDVVEHIEDDQTAINSIAAMTGKYALISTLQGRMRPVEKNVGHVRNYAYGELQAKVEKAGLKVIRVVEWGFPLYSPLYRNLLNFLGGAGTEGEMGPFRKMVAVCLYHLFRLNMWTRGDVIYVLAQRV